MHIELADSYDAHYLARTYLYDFARVKQFFTYDPKKLREFICILIKKGRQGMLAVSFFLY